MKTVEGVVIEDGLVVVNQANVPDIFKSEDSIKIIVEMIRSEVSGHTPDLTTVTGRKAIASLSAKVSKSKVVLDDLGKELTAEWKEKSKVVDAARKIARDELEALRDEVRLPLTQWEQEQERIALAEQEEREKAEVLKKHLEEIERCHEEALLLDELMVLRKKQAEADRIEQERVKKEREDREEQERKERAEKEHKERDERIAREATERAEREAAEKIRKAKEDAERQVREAKEEADRKERQRIADEQEAKRKEDAAKAEEERKAGLKRNIAKKNNEALSDIAKILVFDDHIEADAMAKAIVEAISKDQIRNVKINY